MLLAARLGERVEGEPGGIGARLARDHAGARRARPRSSAARSRRRGTCRRRRASPSGLRRGTCAASLPMVVVLPEPLTPTTRMTNGLRASDRRAASRPARAPSRPRRRAPPSPRPARSPCRSGPRPPPRRSARRRRRRDRRGSAPPRSRRASAASSLRLATRSVIARADRRRGALEPAAQALPPASAVLCAVLSFMPALP